ncbi:MAG: hypothetical protein KGJ90_01865 [Patescibacteria group bacterium]|nr:hypothetical protein [Patescibacteria group bacterium]
MIRISKDEVKARKLYKFLFGEGLPWNWRVELKLAGATFYGGETPTIIAIAPTFEDAIPTLVHEFVHQRHRGWSHGKRFDREVQRLLKMVIKYT